MNVVYASCWRRISLEKTLDVKRIMLCSLAKRLEGKRYERSCYDEYI